MRPRTLYGRALPIILIVAGMMLPTPTRGEGAPPDAKVPKVFCAEPVFDFGLRRDQETVRHTFIIENRGNADLLVLNVRTSCGCTTAEISRKTIPPGETAELRTAFALRGRRGPETKKVYVRTNDLKTPTLTCTLQGRVKRTFLLDPRKLYFYTRDRDDAKAWTKKLFLGIEASKPWKITKIEAPKPVFLSTRILRQDDYETEIEVSLDKDYFIDKTGARGNLVIYTTHPKYTKLYVPVRVHAVPVVRIRPTRIPLPAAGARSAAKRATRTVMMKSELPDRLELVDVDAPEGVEVTVKRLPTYIIELHGLEGKKRDELKGKTIRIRTRIEGKEHVFAIPIE